MAGIQVAEEEADPATIAAVSDGLDNYNEAQVGPDTSSFVWIIARDEEGKVQGGLKGIKLWSWFLIDWLWVSEEHRRQGIGSRLLAAGEAAARREGCTGAFLNSFSFQAPEFYKRHGYEEFARLDDFPPGHKRYWLKKSLAGEG